MLTGHTVDPVQDTQLYEKPEHVLEAWSQWRHYLEKGPRVATKEELTARDEKIRELQAQIDSLKAGRGFSKEDIRGIVAEFIAEKKRR